ncbi:hypothetical protein AB0D04_32495 [Streptomyces sp. NPDC048483]
MIHRFNEIGLSCLGPWEKPLEGQVIAASKGNPGKWPKAIDDSLTFALAL